MEDYREICPKCERYKACEVVCPAIDILANNDKAMKEKHLSYDGDRVIVKDYKEVLIEAQNSGKKRMFKDFEQFRDRPRLHLIALGLQVRIRIKDIARAMNIDETTVRRYKKNGLT